MKWTLVIMLFRFPICVVQHQGKKGIRGKGKETYHCHQTVDLEDSILEILFRDLCNSMLSVLFLGDHGLCAIVGQPWVILL